MYQMLSIARGHITTRNLIYKVINKPKNTRRFNFQEFYKSLNVCGRIKRMNETDASTINKKHGHLPSSTASSASNFTAQCCNLGIPSLE